MNFGNLKLNKSDPDAPAVDSNTTPLPPESTVKEQNAAEAFADRNYVKDSESPTDTGERLWSSAPIMRLRLGKFQFDRGVLALSESKDISDFEQLLTTLPARERNGIKTINRELAETMVRPIEPGMTQAFDSSVGRQKETVAGSKVIGDEPLEGTGVEKFAKIAQTDGNKPVDGTADMNVANQANEGDVDTANRA